MPDMSTLSRAVKSSSAFAAIVVTLGIEMVVSAVKPINALALTSVTSGSIMLVKAVQPTKASFPITVTAGKVMLTKLVQSLNTRTFVVAPPVPTEVALGRFTVVNDVQPSNAVLPTISASGRSTVFKLVLPAKTLVFVE